MKYILYLLLVITLVGIIGIIYLNKNRTTSPNVTSEVVDIPVRSVADEIINSFREKRFTDVSNYVLTKVRFSPYIYVNLKTDKVLSKEVVGRFLEISAEYQWGIYEGSGMPISLPTGEYYKKFIYDKDYVNAPEILVNDLQTRGSSINNVKQIYPNAEFVEYYFPPTEEGGLDWSSLILVLEKQTQGWNLVGVVHDAWGI